MLRIVVCEDNISYLNYTVTLIEKILNRNNIQGKVIFKTSNSNEIKNNIKNNWADIYFLDINLNDNITGYMIAENIRKVDINAYIVFISGHLEYVLHAFKVQPFDFLPKPVSEEILEKCILKIEQNYYSQNIENHSCFKHIEIKTGSIVHKVKTNIIVYIERLKSKTIIYTQNSEISCNFTLRIMHKMIDDENFIRCHKSFIANKTLIDKICLKEKKIYFETG